MSSNKEIQVIEELADVSPKARRTMLSLLDLSTEAQDGIRAYIEARYPNSARGEAATAARKPRRKTATKATKAKGKKAPAKAKGKKATKGPFKLTEGSRKVVLSALKKAAEKAKGGQAGKIKLDGSNASRQSLQGILRADGHEAERTNVIVILKDLEAKDKVKQDSRHVWGLK